MLGFLIYFQLKCIFLGRTTVTQAALFVLSNLIFFAKLFWAPCNICYKFKNFRYFYVESVDRNNTFYYFNFAGHSRLGDPEREEYNDLACYII
jgi:hypothetical protein